MDYNAELTQHLTHGTQQNNIDTPTYALETIQKRTFESDESSLVDMAIDVAIRGMQDDDIKTALDSAKAAMAWIGRGGSKKTIINAHNAQINQLEEDPQNKKAILAGLKDISMLTEGIRTEDQQIADHER